MTSKESKEKVVEKATEMTDEDMTKLSRAQYNDQVESHQTLLQAKNAELTRLNEMLKSVREAKEPLAKVKATLQEEITKANQAINVKTEEVTLIKQKLRYHSLKQIHENIDRLQYQLRNNNYKPREEQKILDEISMLQRSTKTLQEYEEKQAENKKYRAERARLIDERNTNYSKSRALYAQEDEIKKAMAELRGVISNSRKSLDQLRQLKPGLEKTWSSLQQQQQQVARNKRFEEKRRQRQEQPWPRERQETRKKLWGRYEVVKYPYEEECDYCRVLISYLQSSMNLATPTSTISSPCLRLAPATPLTPSTPASDSEYVGSFYMKPKDEDGFIQVSKREKARAKREHRLSKRVKELRHTPDVLMKFSRLSVSPPINTDQIPAAVIALQDALQSYNNLYMEAKKNKVKGQESDQGKVTTDCVKHLRPTSLPISPPKLLVTEDSGTCQLDTSAAFPELETHESKTYTPAQSQDQSLEHATGTSDLLSTVGNSSESPKAQENSNVTIPTRSWASAVAGSNPTTPETSSVLQDVSVVLNNKPSQEVLCNGVHTPEATDDVSVTEVQNFTDKEKKLCSDVLSLASNESFFTAPISFPNNLVEVNNNNAVRSYASVTAKINAVKLQEI